MTDDAREAMKEIGVQSDPVREALRRMIAEFGDYHYENCPAEFHETSGRHGPCECFDGHLIKDARAALAAHQDGAETMRRLSAVLADAMSWHPSENGPSYTETRNALYDRARNIVLSRCEQQRK